MMFTCAAPECTDLRHDHRMAAVPRLRAAGAIVFGTNSMMGTGSPNAGEVPPTDPRRIFNWEREARNAWDPSRTGTGSLSWVHVPRREPISVVEHRDNRRDAPSHERQPQPIQDPR